MPRTTERCESQRTRLNTVELAIVAKHTQLPELRILQQAPKSFWLASDARQLAKRNDPFIGICPESRTMEPQIDRQSHDQHEII